MRLPIQRIVADSSIDVRERMDESTIQEYMEVFDRLPPVTVFDTPEGYLLADGFHRLSAAERLGRIEIEADVRRGTRQDAEEFAAYANAAAALKLTPEERRIGIRRLHRLHPDWDMGKLASLMSCSETVVRTVLQAIQVRREAPTAARLPDRQLEEIARAPRDHWEPLAKAAVQKDWTTEEVKLAVRNVNDPAVSSIHKQALLRGEAEPVTMKNGEPAVLPETIRRHLVDESKRDYLSFLESLLYNLAQLRRFSAQEVVDGMDVQRLASLVRGLPADVEYLNDILRLGRGRLEL